MSAIIHPDFIFVHFTRTGGSSLSQFLLENVPGCKIYPNDVTGDHIGLCRMDEEITGDISVGFEDKPDKT